MEFVHESVSKNNMDLQHQLIMQIESLNARGRRCIAIVILEQLKDLGIELNVDIESITVSHLISIIVALTTRETTQ